MRVQTLESGLQLRYSISACTNTRVWTTTQVQYQCVYKHSSPDYNSGTVSVRVQTLESLNYNSGTVSVHVQTLESGLQLRYSISVWTTTQVQYQCVYKHSSLDYNSGTVSVHVQTLESGLQLRYSISACTNTRVRTTTQVQYQCVYKHSSPDYNSGTVSVRVQTLESLNYNSGTVSVRVQTLESGLQLRYSISACTNTRVWTTTQVQYQCVYKH